MLQTGLGKLMASKRFGTLALTLTLVATISSGTVRAAMNCERARSSVEKLICADEGLSRIDEQVNELYSGLQKNSFNPPLLKEEQRYWLRNKRDKCGNSECVRLVYRKRLEQLERWGRYTQTWSGTFAHIEFYDDAPPVDLLTDRTIGAKAREVVGTKFSLLEANLSTSSGSRLLEGEYLVADGCAAHACSVAEARLVISKLGKIYVAILDAESVLYFTNDASRMNNPPELIVDFARSRGARKIDVPSSLRTPRQ